MPRLFSWQICSLQIWAYTSCLTSRWQTIVGCAWTQFAPKTHPSVLHSLSPVQRAHFYLQIRRHFILKSFTKEKLSTATTETPVHPCITALHKLASEYVNVYLLVKYKKKCQGEKHFSDMSQWKNCWLKKIAEWNSPGGLFTDDLKATFNEIKYLFCPVFYRLM